MDKSRTALAGFDLHWPEIDWPTWNLMLNFASDTRPSLFVAGGDWLNCEALSPHTKGVPGKRERGQMRREFRSFDKRILSPLEDTLPKSCERVFIIGNHEDWLTQAEAENPELEGLLSLESNLHLSERGWKVIECGKHFRKGKLTYLHGEILRSGMYSARKALETFCGNVLFGHTHSPQSFTKTLPHDRSQKWMAWSSPILGKLGQSYLRNAPTSWVNGFTAIEYHGNDNFNLFPIVVSKRQFSYGGRVYSAAA